MKHLFIPAKIIPEINIKKIIGISKNIPKRLAIAYSIQFQDTALKIKKILSSTHEITDFMQVLGCTTLNLKNTDAVLLIGSGRFHALSIAYSSKMPVYILNKDSLDRIGKSDTDFLLKKQKAACMKFLSQKNIGILISTKQGQQKLSEAIKLKKKLKHKNFYLFLSNDIDTREFENFGLKSYVNTACPRLDFDSSIINIRDVQKLDISD